MNLFKIKFNIQKQLINSLNIIILAVLYTMPSTTHYNYLIFKIKLAVILAVVTVKCNHVKISK